MSTVEDDPLSDFLESAERDPQLALELFDRLEPSVRNLPVSLFGRFKALKQLALWKLNAAADAARPNGAELRVHLAATEQAFAEAALHQAVQLEARYPGYIDTLDATNGRPPEDDLDVLCAALERACPGRVCMITGSFKLRYLPEAAVMIAPDFPQDDQAAQLLAASFDMAFPVKRSPRSVVAFAQGWSDAGAYVDVAFLERDVRQGTTVGDAELMGSHRIFAPAWASEAAVRRDDPIVSPTPPRTRSRTQPAGLDKTIGIAVIVGILALIAVFLALRPSPPTPLAAPAPAPVFAPPEPVASPPPELRITGVRLARNPREFGSIVDQRSFDGPGPLGISVQYEGARDGDTVVVNLEEAGEYRNACAAYRLTSLPDGYFWCAFDRMGVGRFQFVVVINGERRGAYDFEVQQAPAQTTTSPEPSSPMPRPRRRPAEAQPAVSVAPRDSLVSCVLPSGEETRLSLAACRAREGIVYEP